MIAKIRLPARRVPTGDAGHHRKGRNAVRWPVLDVVAMGFKVPVPPRQPRLTKTWINTGQMIQ